jgi:glutamine synthetase
VLPWAPDLARVLCFLYDEQTGDQLDHDSRGNLLRLEARGMLDHADAMTFVGAPSVNSYKRFWDEGHWAPFRKAYGYSNRT